MANPNGAKGAKYEISLLPALQEHISEDVHRLGKQGVRDKGDYWLPGWTPYVIEAKCESSYAGKLSGWLAEAKAEAMNAGKPFGIVVHKRHGQTDPMVQYVTLTLGDWLHYVHRVLDA